MKTGTDETDLDHNHIIKDTTAKVTITPTEAVLGHTIGTTGDITGVVHANHTQTLIHTILTMTPHIEGHLHTGAHQLIHTIAVDHALHQHTGQIKTLHQNSSHSRRSHSNTHTKRNSRVTIDDTQKDFHSSDENSSSSEEDSDQLN